ncbi:MAG: radical SAM protein, partial [Pirellulaceae bacterium]
YIDDALLDTIATTDTILPYLDLPLQHINDRLLKRMARKVTRDEIETLLTRLRDRIPGLALRTTMITGFPGETDAEFEQLHQFIKEQAFERLGVFTYSYESNTPSSQIPDHLPEKVKQQRRDILMQTQRDIMRVGNEQKLRTQLEVILDSSVPKEHNVWIGRTTADAPEVDSHVYVTGNEIPLKTGNIVTCEIVGIRDYDLIAVAIGPVC